MILKCNCVNAFQDKEYGPGMRVHNPCKLKSTSGGRGWRCTVCSNEKPIAASEPKEKK